MTDGGEAASVAGEPEGGGEARDESAAGGRRSADDRPIQEGAAQAAEGVALGAAVTEASVALADEASGGEGEVAPIGGLDEGQLARLREVLVAAHPDAVPELIAGADFEALLGSVAGARAAFARVAASSVPRGGGTREIDPAVFAGLSPEGKIAQGLRGR